MEKRKYPRPTIPCIECGEKLVLCWGNTLDIYCRHKSLKGKKTNCNGAKNGLQSKNNEYTFAKELLYEYLIGGSEIYLQKECTCCENIFLNTNEIKMNSDQCDIAFYENDLFKYGISFVGQITKANILLNHLDVINKLDNLQIKDPVFIDSFCNERNKYVKCIRLNCQNRFIKNNSNNLCELCTSRKQILLKSNECSNTVLNENEQQAIIDQRNNISLNDEYNNISLKEIGQNLGYLTIIDSKKYYTRALKFMDFAENGYIYPKEIVWNLENKFASGNSDRKFNGGNSDSKFNEGNSGCKFNGGNSGCKFNEGNSGRSMWDLFLSKKQCLRCEKSHETSYGRPVCIQCYKTIMKNSTEDLKIKTKVTKTVQTKLKECVQFLYNIDGNWQYGNPCHFCQFNYRNLKNNKSNVENNISNSNNDRKYLDEYGNIKGFVLWKNDKKCCCIPCLDSKLEPNYFLISEFV